MDAIIIRHFLLLAAMELLLLGTPPWSFHSSVLQHGVAATESCSKTQPMTKITGIQPSSYENYTILNNFTMEECGNFCYNNCSCVVAFYSNNLGFCAYTGEVAGSNLVQAGESSGVAFLMIGPRSVQIIFVEDPRKKTGVLIFFTTAVIIFTSMVFAGLVCLFLYYRRRDGCRSCFDILPRQSQDRNPAPSGNHVLKIVANNFIRSFSLKELEDATSDFSMILGSGGFGNVYLGKLSDQTEIAVKKLENWGQGDEEFCTEVSIIGVLYHRNILQLRGYCAENKQRMLVYEYMPNGSLDEWLFSGSSGSKLKYLREPLPWPTRMKIVAGIARGLAYIHQECRNQVVHLDIKPDNVLLDKNFVPKLSDFGFSKVMNQNSTAYSRTRGTPGYMAPEWLLESTASSKSDVYSFGMVLLEIIGGRRNHDQSREGGDDVYYPCWAMKKLVEGKVRDVIDERITENEICDGNMVAEAERLLKVGLFCIQKSVDLRPGIGRVVQMLEGVYPLPSCDSLTSIYLYPSGKGERGEEARSLQSALRSISRADMEMVACSRSASPGSFPFDSPEFLRG